MGSGMVELTKAINDLGEGFDLFRKASDKAIAAICKRIDAIEQNGSAPPAEIEALRDRIEELEARAASPGRTGKTIQPRQRWNAYHAGADVFYEVPNDVRVADVLGPRGEPEIGFERWLAAAMAGEHCRDTEALEFARSLKAQVTTSTTGVLIPAEYQSQWIDRIRDQMVLNRAGMSTIVMEAKTYNASRLVNDPTASWHSEAGSISVANPTFEARSMTAQTLVTRCTGSLEVSQDSPEFGAQLARAMAASMAVELDRVGLVGSGTPPEPRGIRNTTGRGQVTGVGTITDYAELLQAVRILLDANLDLEVATRVAIMSPRVWEDYEALVTGISGDKTQLARPRALEETRFLVTGNGLDVAGSPSDTSTAFMGDFADLALGVRRNASVEALKLQSYADNLILEFVGYLRSDYLVRRPASFVTIEGVIL